MHPEKVGQHVGVGEHDEMQRLGGFLERRLASRKGHTGRGAARKRGLHVSADACCDRVAPARRLESVSQGRWVKQHRELLDGDRGRFRARLQQGLELDR